MWCKADENDSTVLSAGSDNTGVTVYHETDINGQYFQGHQLITRGIIRVLLCNIIHDIAIHDIVV
jgi:hypothetical protein